VKHRVYQWLEPSWPRRNSEPVNDAAAIWCALMKDARREGGDEHRFHSETGQRASAYAERSHAQTGLWGTVDVNCTYGCRVVLHGTLPYLEIEPGMMPVSRLNPPPSAPTAAVLRVSPVSERIL